jgi:hypothetical protein
LSFHLWESQNFTHLHNGYNKKVKNRVDVDESQLLNIDLKSKLQKRTYNVALFAKSLKHTNALEVLCAYFSSCRIVIPFDEGEKRVK